MCKGSDVAKHAGLDSLMNFRHFAKFEGVCLTSVMLAPGASEVGLGAAALAPLCVDNALPRLRSPRSFFVRRVHT